MGTLKRMQNDAPPKKGALFKRVGFYVIVLRGDRGYEKKKD